MALGRGNSIAVRDIETDKATSVDGIFAAGDAIYGTKSVIMAIESGRELQHRLINILAEMAIFRKNWHRNRNRMLI